MSKKTIRKSIKKTATKKPAAKSTPRKSANTKGSAKKSSKQAKKTVVARAGGKGAKTVVAKAKAVVATRTDAKPTLTSKTAPAVSAPAPKPEVSLGRPLVTQEEKLYMLFHDDFQARQVFEFLRVHTVKELEQFSQQQIVHMMSKPLRMTVDRIRQRLAQFKRSLRDDEQYAADFRKQAD